MTSERDPPFVTVIIPAYNAEETIERALDSVVIQAMTNLEVIVIDDTSTDRTAELARRYTDILPQMKVIAAENNLGVSAARNMGIRAASGSLIAFLDADDEWLAGKISTQINALVEDPTLIFVSCEAILLSSSGHFLNTFNEGRARPHGRDGWKRLLSHPCIATPGIVVWKERLHEAGGFDTSLPTGEDQDLWIRLAMLGPVRHLDETFVHVYDTQDSLSKREHADNIPNILPIIRKQLRKNKAQLTNREVRKILGSRYQIVGRDFCRADQFFNGAQYLLMASLKGFEPIQNFMYLLKNLPPVRGLKVVLGPGGKS